MAGEKDHIEAAELRQAFEWTCDGCGRDSFARAVIAEFSPEEAAEMREEGADPRQGWVTIPETVTCQHCGRTYRCVDANDTL
jgi:hypothetical protein